MCKLHIFLILPCLIWTSCDQNQRQSTHKTLSFQPVPLPPMGPAFYPNMAISSNELLMNWVEDINDSTSQLKIASWDGNQWGEQQVIAQGNDWFVNWADFPAVGRANNGQLAAHYLAKVGAGTYAYGVFMVQSDSNGKDWRTVGSPHKDTSATEHGFMSMVPMGDDIGMVWLDGRKYATAQKQMELRYTNLNADHQFGEEVLLDDRVCDCCQTGVTATSSGAVVVYRNRSQEEIRDIYRVVLKNGEWSEPAPIFNDNWKIAGCPVNGPAIDAREDQVAVAWYAKPGDSAEVKVSFSNNGGEAFDTPIRIDQGNPEGRVDVLMMNEQFAWVSWMENVDDGAEIRLRAVYADGTLGPVNRVDSIAPSRSSGFPILRQFQNQLYIAWTEPGEPSQLRLVRAKL